MGAPLPPPYDVVFNPIKPCFCGRLRISVILAAIINEVLFPCTSILLTNTTLCKAHKVSKVNLRYGNEC